MLNFGWLKFGEPRMTRQIRQTFPPPNIPAIRYSLAFSYIMKKQCFMKDRLGFVDKKLHEITLEYYTMVLHNIVVIFTCRAQL